MSFYIRLPLLWTAIIAGSVALSSRNLEIFKLALLTYAIFLLAGTKTAEQLGNKLIQFGKIARARFRVPIPVPDFMIFFTGVMVYIQWHMFADLISVQKGLVDENLVKLFMVMGYLIPLVSLVAFCVNHVTGATCRSKIVNQVILYSQLLFLGLAVLFVSFFSQSYNTLVYSSHISLGLTYFVIGLWEKFSPRTRESDWEVAD